METSKLKWYGDSAHAWLAVPMALARKVDGISGFSYQSPKGSKAYLECDCDAPKFIEFYGLDGVEIPCADPVNGSSPIRKYPRYEFATVTQ